jgi:hypothetical protein
MLLFTPSIVRIMIIRRMKSGAKGDEKHLQNYMSRGRKHSDGTELCLKDIF